jgi:hypothetical protein
MLIHATLKHDSSGCRRKYPSLMRREAHEERWPKLEVGKLTTVRIWVVQQFQGVGSIAKDLKEITKDLKKRRTGRLGRGLTLTLARSRKSQNRNYSETDIKDVISKPTAEAAGSPASLSSLSIFLRMDYVESKETLEHFKVAIAM